MIIHELILIIGELAVADILLWRDRNLSAALLGGMTVIWFLFEIVEYNFVTLLCHISITTMLVLFIWSTAADIFKWYLFLLNIKCNSAYEYIDIQDDIDIHVLLWHYDIIPFDKYIFRKPPQIPDIILQESFFQDLAFILHRRFNQLLPMLLHISCGIDLPIFLLVHNQFSFSFTNWKWIS